MGFLIDTCIWIDVERGRLSAADIAAIVGNEPVFLSPVTIAELKHGVDVCTDHHLRQRRSAGLRRLMKKPVLRVDGETGETFGSLSAAISSMGRGHAFRVQDLWLAAQSIQHNLTLLTRNEKDFLDIPGLKLFIINTS